MRFALMVVLMAAVAAAQDDGKKQDPVKAVRDDAAKALKATAAKGAFAFEGEATTDFSEELGGVVVDGFYGGIKGKISGTATSGFKAAFRAKSDKATYEAWHDKKTVERMTWRGLGQTPGDAANDILSLVDFEKLAGAVGKAKEGKAGDGKLGDEACKTYQVVLGPEAISTYLDAPDADEDGGGAMMDFGLAATRIELKLWVGSDGLVRKIEAKVVKGMSMNPADGEEEEEQEEGMGELMSSTYTFTFSKFGETKVEIPDDIRELMKK